MASLCEIEEFKFKWCNCSFNGQQIDSLKWLLSEATKKDKKTKKEKKKKRRAVVICLLQFDRSKTTLAETETQTQTQTQKHHTIIKCGDKIQSSYNKQTLMIILVIPSPKFRHTKTSFSRQ